MKNLHGLRGARRFLLIQLSLTGVIAVFALLMSGSSAAVSAMLGGLVSLIPNACFASNVFRYHGARSAKKILNGFYTGEALKIAVAAILFAVIFAFFNIIPLFFFVTYVGVQLLFWFAPLIFDI